MSSPQEIQLTDEQLQQLQPLIDVLEKTPTKDMIAGKVPLVIADVRLTGDDKGTLIVGIIPHEKAVIIQQIMRLGGETSLY